MFKVLAQVSRFGGPLLQKRSLRASSGDRSVSGSSALTPHSGAVLLLPVLPFIAFILICESIIAFLSFLTLLSPLSVVLRDDSNVSTQNKELSRLLLVVTFDTPLSADPQWQRRGESHVLFQTPGYIWISDSVGGQTSKYYSLLVLIRWRIRMPESLPMSVLSRSRVVVSNELRKQYVLWV